MSGDKAARVLAGLAVLAVAVVAGWVSFGHIAMLAAAYGYSTATAHMLPVSVDGLIVASSMALLTGSAPWLSRAGLTLGILATLAANVAAGAQFGIVGGLVNAWPAVAFIVASEILLKMIRATRDLTSAEEAGETVAHGLPWETSEETSGAAPSVPQVEPEAMPADVPPVVPRVVPVALRPFPRSTPRRTSPGKPKTPAKVFSAELASGTVPSLRAIKSKMHVGTARAQHVQRELQEVMQEKAA